MKKSENISVKYPLSINFKTYQQYDLTITKLDEIVFFEWLIVKRLSFGSDEFFYQNDRVIKEIGIKRHRLDKIKKKFTFYGLDIQLKGFTNTTNYIITDEFVLNFVNTHLIKEYRVNTLKQLINLDFKNEIIVSKAEKKRILDLITYLENIYNKRREMKFNKTEGKQKLDHTSLSHNKKTYQQIKLLIKKYPLKNTIGNSFICHVDKLINNEDSVTHILNNFSSYNRANDSFPIFESRLNEFNNNYVININ